jgi:hypothetical protein
LFASACGRLIALSTPSTRGATVVLLAVALWPARRRLREESVLLSRLAPVALAAA